MEVILGAIFTGWTDGRLGGENRQPEHMDSDRYLNQLQNY